jgi:hypothetical protein
MFDFHQCSLNVVGFFIDLSKQVLRWFDALPF